LLVASTDGAAALVRDMFKDDKRSIAIGFGLRLVSLSQVYA
jgi:hypothetical protein